MTDSRNVVTASDVPAFEYGDWEATERAFENAAAMDYGQSWLSEPEAAFLPGRVKVGRHGSTLLFYAELTDYEIYTDAKASGDGLWALGDTFEIFLKPEGRDVYYELHVSPENHVLELRWPTTDTIFNLKDTGESWEAFKSPYSIITSHTAVQPEKNRWLVLAAIDGERVAEDNGESGGYDNWRLSFSRYDYDHGREEVLSSTSPHTEANFHLQAEWRVLSFAS